MRSCGVGMGGGYSVSYGDGSRVSSVGAHLDGSSLMVAFQSGVYEVREEWPPRALR